MHVHRLIRLNSSSILEEEEHPEYLLSIVQFQTHLGSMSPLGMGGEKKENTGLSFRPSSGTRSERTSAPRQKDAGSAQLSLLVLPLSARSLI